jgi:hypothetical protein
VRSPEETTGLKKALCNSQVLMNGSVGVHVLKLGAVGIVVVLLI